MSKHSKLSIVESEGIDAIVDSVAADPTFASQAKSMLHDKVKAQRSVARFPPTTIAANDDEDLWDNMPV
ncbi:MAG: hypothetical protein ABJF50_02065 [Paracoccaceae bacterium]